MGRTDQSDGYHNPAITAEWKWPKTASPDDNMAEAIQGMERAAKGEHK